MTCDMCGGRGHTAGVPCVGCVEPDELERLGNLNDDPAEVLERWATEAYGRGHVEVFGVYLNALNEIKRLRRCVEERA